MYNFVYISLEVLCFGSLLVRTPVRTRIVSFVLHSRNSKYGKGECFTILEEKEKGVVGKTTEKVSGEKRKWKC